VSELASKKIYNHMRFFFDTEFLEDGQSIELISIAIVSEQGDEYYACVKDADWNRIDKDAWLKQHVLFQLPDGDDPAWKTKAQIAKEIVAFVGDNPEFWADFGAYDWVALCQLYGKIIHMPGTWPMFFHEIQQFKELVGIDEFPVMNDNEHNALVDARETKARFDMCMGAARAKGIKIAASSPSFPVRLAKALQYAHGQRPLAVRQPKFRR
jgi:hypothetical protein